MADADGKRPGFQSVPGLIRKITYVFYRPSIRRIMRSMGIHKTAKALYWRLLWRKNPVVSYQDINYRAPSPSLLESHVRGIESERVVIDSFLDAVSRGDTVFDIGGFEGLYSALSSLKGADTVVMVEPTEKGIDGAKAICKENGIDAVEFVQAAVSTADSSEVPSAEEISFDDLVEQYGSPDIVKLDIEGAEGLVLKDAEEHLSDIGTVYCEIHTGKLDSFNSSETEIRNILTDEGFTVETLYDRGNNVFVQASQ